MHVQLTIDQSWWHDHMICLCAWFRPIHKKWFNLAVVDFMSCNVLIYQCNWGRLPGGHVASFRYSSSDFLAMQLLLCLWPPRARTTMSKKRSFLSMVSIFYFGQWRRNIGWKQSAKHDWEETLFKNVFIQTCLRNPPSSRWYTTIM